MAKRKKLFKAMCIKRGEWTTAPQSTDTNLPRFNDIVIVVKCKEFEGELYYTLQGYKDEYWANQFIRLSQSVLNNDTKNKNLCQKTKK